jgi:hypothetical protein
MKTNFLDANKMRVTPLPANMSVKDGVYWKMCDTVYDQIFMILNAIKMDVYAD